MNTEEDEFRRIEAEALRLWAAQTDDDDDTQIYKKPWQGLTIEEIGDIFNNTPNPTEKVGPFVIRFSRAIEAKLKEKNT